jgi:hypothetical protein
VRLDSFTRGMVAGLYFTCASVASAGVNSWTMTGPDAGSTTALAIHPTNSQISVVSTTRGLYRTSNGSSDWSLVSEYLMRTASSIAFDPSNPNRVFAANGKLWRSNDAGQTFAVVSDPSGGLIYNVGFSGGTLYAHSSTAQVYRSTNQGSSWTNCALPGGVLANSTAFLVDPDSNRLLIETQTGSSAPGSSITWRSADGCNSWTAASVNPGTGANGRVYQYSVKKGDANRVLASTDLGIYLSTDGGATWTLVYGTNSWWVAFDPTPAGSGTALAVVGAGLVIVSTDSGTNWTYRGSLRTLGEVRLVFDPAQNGRLFATTQQGTFLSTDGGASFALRASSIRAGWASDFSAADDGTIYTVFSQGASGVFRRSPLTKQWDPVTDQQLLASVNIPAPHYMSHVAVAPTNSSNLYAGVYNGLVVHSTDGGASWMAPVPEFYTPTGSTIVDTVIDPDDAQVAYSASNNSGIWKTIDGGAHWAQVNNGITLQTWHLAAARGSDLVYAAAGGIADLFPKNLYKSANGGGTWTPAGFSTLTPGSNSLINQIVIDPKDSNVVYVVSSNAVHKTTNGGTTWQPLTWSGVSDTTIAGAGLAIDPVHSTTLVASRTVYGYGLARTVDGGATWEPILLQLPGETTYFDRVVLEPQHPNVIIAAVMGANIAEYEVATDLAVTLPTLPLLSSGTTFPATFTVENRGPHGASPARLELGFPSWVTPTFPNFCTRTGQMLDCTLPPLHPGDTLDVPLSFAISVQGGVGALTAQLVTHETDLDSLNNQFTRGISAIERADLVVGIAPNGTTSYRGDPIPLVATVTNNGPSPSSLTTLALQVPAGLVIDTVTPQAGGTCMRNGQAINCSFGSVAANAAASVSVALQAPTVGTYIINAQADGQGTDNGIGENASTTLVVRPSGDLSVSLAESADPVTVGETLTYTITLRNESGDASDAQVVVPVTGARVTGVGVTAGVSCTANLVGNFATCEVPSLATGATAVGYVTVTSTVPTIATATATAMYGGRDSNPGNDTATIGTTVRLVGDVSVEISDSMDPASVSVPFQYTVTVRNAGPNAGAVNVAIPVTGANISAATTPAGSCTMTAGTANCAITSLAGGGSAVITLTAFTAAPGTASATATATFAGFDPDTANNSATAQTVVRAVADIGVTIADSADPVAAGGSLSYLVTLTSAGPSPGDVHLTVPVTGSTVTGATPSQGGNCAFTTASVTCDFAPMDFSPSTVNILINSATAGTVTATATATFSGTDPVATNNTATATTTVNAPPSSSSSSGGGSSGGGGGGGGRFDWLAALLLGALLASRGRRMAMAR